ncbi:multidrug and toxin extrusion protein 1 [Larimichthys crocea]|uniref:multidrug and toxin extrusion protein 1 n=1 Tax=Larimichthys crocea TaxID=215358 RepID=UPI000F5E860B|nr:multidrug and toxin extrusion protein 1 [Larimichthys crocea]
MENLGSPEPACPSPGAGPVAGVSVGKRAGVEGDEAAVSSKLFRSACIRRWLPLAYREEVYHVLRLTGPLLLSRILNFFLPFVTTIFCGHIGNAELAGYALASATVNVTTSAAGYGLAMACDTLISQTFGSKNMKRVGVILQRSSLILLLFCLPCWALVINSHNLLLLLHQDAEVARIAQIYIMAFLPAIPAIFLHQLQVSYLQNQGIIMPQMYTAAAANIFNLAANYILISSLKLGVIGSAIANSLSQVVICLMLFGYIRWKKLHRQTWGGWSTECLQEWGSYMKLAVPSAFMICFEWWIWEIAGFLAGVLGKDDIAAQHIMVELTTITYMFPLGVHAAACVRVGNALGAGDTSRAIVTCKVVFVLIGTLAVFQGIAIAGCKSVIGHIFTTENIVRMVSANLTIYIFLQFFDGLLCVSSGILVGAGMQKIAALSNLVAYYFIGLPAGIAMMFYTELRILGFWLGIFIGVFLETGFFLILIFKFNWKKVTHKAQLRAGKKVVLIPKRPVSIVLNEEMVPDISDFPNTAQLDGEEAPKGYNPVNTQDQELKWPRSCFYPSAVLRRGLTVLVSALVLAIGIALHFAFPAPEPPVQSMANFTLNWANDSTPTPLAALDLTTNL